MKKKQITAVLLGGMVLIAMIFSAQGSLLTSMIARFDLKSSAQGLAYTLCALGGALVFIVNVFLIGRIP